MILRKGRLAGPGSQSASRPVAVSGRSGTPAILEVMATVQLPKTNERPTEDPHHAAAVERGKAAVRKLQERGIIDSQGRRIRTDLPADMKDGEDRNFGA